MQNEIGAAARGWVGTRFHHQGRLKKTDTHRGGVDCLGLLVGVAAELQMPIVEYDETDYPHYPDTGKLRKKLSEVMREVKTADIQAGDVVLLTIDGNPQHLGIVGWTEQGMTLIHAYAPARAVVEHPLDDWWRGKIVVAFRVVSG